MAQWKGKKRILEKYGITSRELDYIIKEGEVTYADVNGVLMVDEKSFVAYIDTIQQIHRKDNIVNRLKRALHLGEELKLNKTEARIGREIEGCVDMVYTLVTTLLSDFLEEEEQEIFQSLAKGNRLSTVAKKVKMSKEIVFCIYIEIIANFHVSIPGLIKRVAARYKELEKENKELKNKLAELQETF